MGKTDTIKKRAVWVYLPTIQQRKQWETYAKQQKLSLSKWILLTIEETIGQTTETTKTRKDLEEENQNLKAEIAALQEKHRQLQIIRENLERDIRKYRAEPFLQTGFEGIRDYNKELVETLRNAHGRDGTHRYLDQDELLTRIGIPLTETQQIQALSMQLSNLEKYGLIESGTKGWRWKQNR